MVRYYCSGFDISNIFGHGLGEMIKSELVENKSIVFITGNPNRPEKMDFDRNVIIPNFISSFENSGIKFNEKESYITPDIDSSDAVNKIKNASLLFLLGGDPFEQKKMCEEMGIMSAIKEFNGIMMGMSAGAMLMSKYIIVTPCSDEYHDFRIENGLNMDGISIYPHNNTELEEYPEVLCVGKESYKKDDLINVAKKYGDYYLIQDNKVDDDWDISIIKVDNGIVSLYTENNGKIWEATPNGLNLVTQSKNNEIKKTI